MNSQPQNPKRALRRVRLQARVRWVMFNLLHLKEIFKKFSLIDYARLKLRLGVEVFKENPNPCPFCKSKKVSIEFSDRFAMTYMDTKKNKYSVICETCHMQGPHVISKDIAVWMWNSLTKIPESFFLPTKMIYVIFPVLILQ